VNAARVLTALAGAATRRPLLATFVAVALALAGGALALGLAPSAGINTLVGSSSPSYRATQRFYQRFGDEAVVVLVRGRVKDWVFTQDLERELTMEGCISGNLPAQGIAAHGGPRGPCAQLARAKTVKVVFGPGTFINESAAQIGDQLTAQIGNARGQAAQACQAVQQAALARHRSRAEAQRLCQQASGVVMLQFERNLIATGVRYGLTTIPTINNPDFVGTLIFDPLKAPGTPKARFAYLFPTPSSALVTIRLKPGLSEAQRTHSIDLIRRAVAMPDFAPQHRESYLVTGEPVIVSDLTGSITHSIQLLLIAVLVVMAATLALVFGGRPRLLPLGVALVAAALTFGALALSGSSLTMASIGVLPVLIGLAVDYAIQFQSRVEEESAAGAADRATAVRRAAALGGPTIATAAAATAGGLLVLALSPVPMVRGFGLLLVAGIVAGLLCAFTAGSAVMVLADRSRGRVPGARPTGGLRSPGALDRVSRAVRGAQLAVSDAVGPAWRGASEIVAGNRTVRRWAGTALDQAMHRPGRVLGIGLALAVLGWGLDTQTHVQTDITKLVPQNLSSLRNLNTLERQTGVGGEIDVMVSAPTLSDPRVVNWMTGYQAGLLKHFGYSPSRGCGRAQVCPAFSLPDLFSSANTTGQTANLSQADISGLLDAIPPYFSQGVVTADRRTATLAFGIRLMPLDRQQSVVDEMRRELHPPPGVQADLVGLPVLAAQANAAVSSPWKRVLTLIAALIAVAVVLLLSFRGDRRRALVPLVPIVLATGWSALVLFAIRVPLNPMSVTLGALVIAVSTEFSVLLSERYRQERLAGHPPAEALQRTYSRTGAAVAASATTAIAGFAVLILSDINMLRGFGFVTLVDLTVSLLGVVVVLPSALLLAERGELLTLPRRWLSDGAARLGLGSRAGHEPA
jgi:hydrophobe/amphiphile efflux-3 (HAE3) family protein